MKTDLEERLVLSRLFLSHQLTDAVANVANVLHCAADSNLTMSEETVVRLIEELTQRLNSLMQELLTSVRLKCFFSKNSQIK